METFSALKRSFVRGIHRSAVNSPHKGQWLEALVFSLICAWINGWVNNREASDLRRYRAHYDVTVMKRLAATWQEWQGTRIAILAMVARRFILFSLDLSFLHNILRQGKHFSHSCAAIGDMRDMLAITSYRFSSLVKRVNRVYVKSLLL